MKQEATRQKILDKALELFSTRGYDAVSVGEIAEAVGIKAPSLYNHFPSKRAIFDAIVEATAAQYEADTDRIDIHVQNVTQDIPAFTEIAADALFEKVRQIFEYSLHDNTISRFRRMMTLEQFRSPELAALFSRRYVERVVDYHAGIFRALIAAGEIRPVEQQHIDEATLRPAPKIFKEDCRIDWEKPGREIVNFVRGLSPYPAAWTEMYREGDGEASSAKIFSASFEAAVHGEACGTLQSDGRTFIRVACADGWIALGELQIAGKKRLAVRELLLGWRDVQQCCFRE